eukprot:s1226_g31.t1
MSTFGGAQEITFQLKSKESTDVCGRLYLGSHESARLLPELKDGKIQLVVNCTNDEEVPCFHADKGIKYLRIAVNDNESAMILPYLDGAADAIATAVGQGENVLVHCQQGISRSATILAAFLIKHCGLTADAAIALIQSCRHVANPNVGFRHQLQDFQRAASGSGTATSLDQNWCYQSLGRFATGRADEAFASLESNCESNPRRVLQLGLDFVLGRGIKDSDVLWYASLLRTLETSYSSCNALELLWQELTSEDFQESWGPDFSPQLLQDTLYVTLKKHLERKGGQG